MGIPYPGGVNLDKIAVNGNEKAYSLPHPRVEGSEFDFSFSGLKTAAINIIHNAEQKGEKVNREDLCASYLNAVTDCLCNNTVKAMKDYGFKKLALAGGVSANSVLRRKMTEFADENGWQLFLPELSLCGDNAAMIGSQAYYEYLKGNIASTHLNAYATMPIDNPVF
jgi:N6-L-threonylcarbamoyladenine synthase